jgi:D-alanyl-D-alanine carboxypeptidase/D-alanyl-D-alanine-endopeptidase (penicillin-binding protein 4)
VRIGGRVAAFGIFGAIALVGALALRPRAEPDPIALELTVPDPVRLPAPRIEILPDQVPPLGPAAQLEQRLAALAAAVEAGRLGEVDDALVEFDVEGLAASLEEILLAHERMADVSVHVRDLRSQHVLFDYYGDTPLIPASNQKLVTSAAALDLLGSDYVFRTRIGVVDRDLYLRGEGDPTLQLEDLAQMAETVVRDIDLAAIDKLVVDDGAFSARRFGPGYDEAGPGYAYEAPSGALSCNFNTLEATVFVVKGESALGLTIVPPAPGAIVVKNRARVGKRNALGVVTEAGDDGQTVVRIEGTLKRSARPSVFRRRVVDPGVFTGSAFSALLAELSASEPLPVERGTMPEHADLLVEHESAPLIEVLDAGLAYSNNFIAEQVLRTLAWRMTGDPGGWDAGQQILHDYWAALIGDPDTLVVENAAGLTRNGRATTSGLVDLITLAHRAAPGSVGLLDALPVAGEAGTLKTRLRLSGKRVRAKTGTLNGVSGLSGVITLEDGTPQIGFSILINAIEGSRLDANGRRRIEDAIVMQVLGALDDYAAQKAGVAEPRGAQAKKRKKPKK